MFSLKQKKRVALAVGVFFASAAVVMTLLSALNQNLHLYYSPSMISDAPLCRPIRVGGLVVPGSVKRGNDATVTFTLTDGVGEIDVSHTGALPDLFREGQGIVALGSLHDGTNLHAVQVLAKHDENYMPKEVAESLKLGENNAP